MHNVAQEIAKLLQEIHESSSLAPDSRSRVASWLSAGSEWELVRALGEVLQVSKEAGIPARQFLTRLTVALDPEPVPEIPERFFRDVPLPAGLTKQHLREAMIPTQQLVATINHNLRDITGFPLTHYIQANNFSGVVSNMLTDAIDQVSPYKHNHDQRYPDLKNPSNGVGLEMKAANHPGKGGESHNGHGGWHLIACFDLDEASGNIQFVHIEVADLVGHLEEPEGDWHYCGSKVDEETGSQRTETYYTTNRGTSKLRDGSVYLDTDRVTNWKKWRHGQEYPIPPHSPLYFQRIDDQEKVPSPTNPYRLVSWSAAKKQLRERAPNWPLYSPQELADIGLPQQLIQVIRPEGSETTGPAADAQQKPGEQLELGLPPC